MNNHKPKILLYEPGKSGHRPVILRYIQKGLSDRCIDFLVIDNFIEDNNLNLISNLVKIGLENKCNILHILTVDGLIIEI
jgi:hypothetical protein